jgi:hypothetical protein
MANLTRRHVHEASCLDVLRSPVLENGTPGPVRAGAGQPASLLRQSESVTGNSRLDRRQ